MSCGRKIGQFDCCSVVQGDCLELMAALPEASVDAVITSPPYAEQREYCGLPERPWIENVSALALLQGDVQFLVNLGLIHRNGTVWRYWDELISLMESAGNRLFGWYVWDKGFGAPGNWNGRLAPAHEFIFHFNRSARVVNKIDPTVTIGMRTGNGLRRPDGTMSGISSPGMTDPYKVPDSVLRMFPQQARNGPEREHPAVFPLALPLKLARAFTDPEQIILDPFCGSGTTLVAAAKLGRHFLGIEISEEYCDIARARLAPIEAQPTLFQSPAEQLLLETVR